MKKEEARKKVCPVRETENDKCMTDRCMAWQDWKDGEGHCEMIPDYVGIMVAIEDAAGLLFDALCCKRNSETTEISH